MAQFDGFVCVCILGIGTGLGYTTGIVIVGYNFDKRQSLAMGVAVSGAGVGMLTLSALMQFARDNYGDFGFFMFLAGVFGRSFLSFSFIRYGLFPKLPGTRRAEKTQAGIKGEFKT